MSENNQAITKGLNHLGLSVKDLNKTSAFFVELLGWQQSGLDLTYPRCAVSDGALKLTLWQVQNPAEVADFSRRKHLGLHHLALEMSSEQALDALYDQAKVYPGVSIEFAPEWLGAGPRKHMMCTEPGGLRIEFIWPGI
ncbi:MAG: VOC family protein [Oceanospirillaceae bacterium]|nr:VOC family protein [Oceanospirillaceae bacterium]